MRQKGYLKFVMAGDALRRRLSRVVNKVRNFVACRRWKLQPRGGQAAIRPYYERRTPSRQTIIDIFAAGWKSALPDGQSGKADLFDDRRLAWLDHKIPDGLQGKSVLELGPFEGYHTYQLDQMGAGEIVSVEGNSITFLKCLCVKEMYALKAGFAFGDIQAFLDHCDRRFDLVFASGVLYHSQEPVRFIEQAARIATHLYIWTHYYSQAIPQLSNGQEKHFIPDRNRVLTLGTRQIQLYARSYLMPGYRSKLPMYWEGGQEDVSYWLAKDDLLWLIDYFCFEVVARTGESDQVNGLPCMGVYARKKHQSAT